jgi:hypothetical protein
MLREVLKPSGTPRPSAGGCLDAETLAAWMEGALPPSEAARLETHAAVCPRCQALVATFARTQAAAPAHESSWQRWHLRWLVPLAAAATTVAIWIAVPATPPSAPSADFDLQSGSRVPSQTVPSPTPPQPSGSTAGGGTPPGTVGASAQAASEESREVASARPDSAERETALSRLRVLDSDQQARLGNPSSQVASAAQEAAQTVQPSAPPAAAPAPPSVAETVTLSGRAGLAAAVRREVTVAAEIVSPTPAIRWRILPGGSVERTVDNGERWDAVALPAPGATLLAGSSPDASTCWIVGRAGAIRLTTDGARFSVVPFTEQVDLIAVRATSAAAAVVTTSDGREFRTENQGRTWTRVP